MLLFILIGAGNTLLSMLLMFGMYNLLHFGYWFSSAIAFFICSIISFFNKRFTFNNKDSVLKTGIKFAIVISVCYAIAFEVSKHITILFFQTIQINLVQSTIEQIALLLGNAVFTCLNYLGQRFFAFAKKGRREGVQN